MEFFRRNLNRQMYSIKCPVFQPCGQKLNFICNYSGVSTIWEHSIHDRKPAQITLSKENVTFVASINATGKRIIGVDIDSNENEQLFLLNEDGSVTPLTNSPKHIHRYGGSSPNGKWISWSSNRGHLAFFDVYIQNIETLEIHQVLKGNGMYSAIQWSPDGSSLLIERLNSQLDNDLFLLHLSTGQMNWLTKHEGEANFLDPHFNESGDHLYLLTNKDRKFYGLAMIDISKKASDLA